MRLINVKTYEVVEHMNDDVVQYAILSHTWGAEEIILQEMNLLDERIKAKQGFKKIEYTCRQARSEGFDWAWVDTCCIDKTSSAELSEAINSMFRWYRQSQVCYVYLADLPDQPGGARPDTDTLAKCRWFTRGWCLQELLAPTSLDFYSQGWDNVGSLSDLVESVSEITRIDADYLTKKLALDDASIAARMSWAAGRQCSRLEDTAYSLLGIFDVNIPLLYGEGPKAFTRLQEEIWRETDDHTLLAWHVGDEDPRAWKASGVFAESPDDFRFSSQVVSTGLEDGVPSGMTKRGLSLFASTQELAYPFRSDWSVYQIPLNCADMTHGVEDGGRQIMLLACGVSTSKQTYARVATPAHFYRYGFRNLESRRVGQNAEGSISRTIYIQKRTTMHGRPPYATHVEIPESNVLFLLEGPMQPKWYESQWGIDQRMHGFTFPSVPWCSMGDFRWFQDPSVKYTKIPESSFFILQLGGSASPYMDNTAAVIETTALRGRPLDPPRYAQFLLVQREEMAGGFRVGMKMPVEIRCAIRLVPYTTQASIALLPWDEDERPKGLSPRWVEDIRLERDMEHHKMMEKWTVNNLGRSHTKENAEGRLLLAQASLDLKKSRNKRRRLHVEMLMEKRPDIPWEDWHAEEFVTPHIHLRFTMVDL